MIREMRIAGLGVIDDAVLALTPGLNVVTGETGAGKTMVVSGLGLLLGARADAGLVRAGAARAVVEGIVEVPPDHPAAARAAEAGGDPGGDCGDGLVLVRSVGADGRSRAHVGGRSAPISLLTELGELLVAVHGQADQWRLRRPEQHRALLDEFGADRHGTRGAAARYTSGFATLTDLVAEHQRVRALARDRAVESEILRSAVEEISAVDPQPGEDADLRLEEERLAHADALRAGAGRAHDTLDGADADFALGAVAALHAARGALAQVSGVDPALAEMERRLVDLGLQVADVAGDLAGYLASLEVDPNRLAVVQDRRADIGRLTRKYGDSVDEVLAWGARAALRLAELDGAEDRAEELLAQVTTARAELGESAAALSAARRAAAAELGAAVGAELAHLAMGSAVVEVGVEQRPDPTGLTVPGLHDPVRFGPNGIDDVEIRLSANPGAPPRSVAKVASGGELSRVMLALEVVLGSGSASDGPGRTSTVPTFVFDEVDAGVGGRAALDVGARLRALSRFAQVIVVTHLAQVAAYADTHLVVRKASDGAITSSGVTVLDEGERLTELARMMAGMDDSEAAREHAADLLSMARRTATDAAPTRP